MNRRFIYNLPSALVIGLVVTCCTDSHTLAEAFQNKYGKSAWEVGKPWDCSIERKADKSDFCYTPQIMLAEWTRRTFHTAKLCALSPGQPGNKHLLYYREQELLKFTDSCNSEKLPGYDQAVIEKYEPIVAVMRAEQGHELPSLSEEDFRKCGLQNKKEKYSDDPAVRFELHYRKCAKNPTPQVTW